VVQFALDKYHLCRGRLAQAERAALDGIVAAAAEGQFAAGWNAPQAAGADRCQAGGAARLCMFRPKALALIRSVPRSCR
jgi:hypothetical protein